MAQDTPAVKAVVTSLNGDIGNRYAVCKVTDPANTSLQKGATVTFSLSSYQGSNGPKSGQVVLLDDIEEFSRGWRANAARPVKA